MAKPSRIPAPQGQSGSAMYVRTGTPSLEVVPDMAALEASAVQATDSTPGSAPETGNPTPAPAPVSEPELPAASEPVVPEQSEPADPLAVKWEQMTPEQRAESWRNAQQMIGKQGEEVGILRKAVDRFASAPVQPPVTVAPKAPEPPALNLADDSALVTDLLTNPTRVIKALMDQAEERVMGKLNQKSVEQQMQERRARDLPLFQQSPEAVAWLSKVPPALIQQADVDPQMWDFLMSQAPVKRPGAPAQAPAQAVSRPPVNLGPSAAPSAAAKPAQTGKTWTRREIGELYINRPDEYALRSDEIARAYAENRVRD